MGHPERLSVIRKFCVGGDGESRNKPFDGKRYEEFCFEFTDRFNTSASVVKKFCPRVGTFAETRFLLAYFSLR